jgi:ribonuclease D
MFLVGIECVAAALYVWMACWHVSAESIESKNTSLTVAQNQSLDDAPTSFTNLPSGEYQFIKVWSINGKCYAMLRPITIIAIHRNGAKTHMDTVIEDSELWLLVEVPPKDYTDAKAMRLVEIYRSSTETNIVAFYPNTGTNVWERRYVISTP